MKRTLSPLQPYKNNHIRSSLLISLPILILFAALWRKPLSETQKQIKENRIDVLTMEIPATAPVLTVRMQREERLRKARGAIAEGNIAAVQEILKQGFPVDTDTAQGTTLLMLAAQRGQLNTVRLLTERRANLNAENGEGDTALTLAVRVGHVEVVDYLLKHNPKADIDHKYRLRVYGFTTLDRAIPHDDIRIQRTLLMIAVENGNLELVRALIAHHANVNVGTVETPLASARISKHSDIVAILLKAGAKE